MVLEHTFGRNVHPARDIKFPDMEKDQGAVSSKAIPRRNVGKSGEGGRREERRGGGKVCLPRFIDKTMRLRLQQAAMAIKSVHIFYQPLACISVLNPCFFSLKG